MKKSITLLTAAMVLVTFGTLGYAASFEADVDQFYGGLGAVVERNMDNPDQCLAEVDEYYRQNQAMVDKIREQTEKAMAQTAAMMEKYQHTYAQMSEAELEALERQAKQQEAVYGGGSMAPGMARYTKAMEKFTMKYPQQGLEITTKLIRIVPV